MKLSLLLESNSNDLLEKKLKFNYRSAEFRGSVFAGSTNEKKIKIKDITIVMRYFKFNTHLNIDPDYIYGLRITFLDGNMDDFGASKITTVRIFSNHLSNLLSVITHIVSLSRVNVSDVIDYINTQPEVQVTLKQGFI